jgi:hypothetical protein
VRQTSFHSRLSLAASDAHAAGDRADAQALLQMAAAIDRGDFDALQRLAARLAPKYRQLLGPVPGRPRPNGRKKLPPPERT